ncbi:MAG: thioredoxin-disulfide reductase [Desulfuromonadales bacterium]|nr:thioredoxin-disulfide reductase [Desulfuromonadales bacterium]
MKRVVIYTKETCPYCVRAKQLFKAKEVEYEEIRIDTHPEERDKMIERASGKKTVPQIFIGDVHVGGSDDLFALEERGELNALLDITESSKQQDHRRLIILGSGPAGYTAAIYAARANLSPTIITGVQKGGQLTTTTEVENFPGFPEGIDGSELITKMEEQAVRFGTETVFGQIDRVDLAQRPFQLWEGKSRYSCDALIIATGATARYLGLESEERYKNRGVSACATCDGFFFRNQHVAVVGGGDTALEEAIYLAGLCTKVYLIHRRDEFRASKTMQDRVEKNPKIEILWNTVVDEVIGEESKGMTDLRVKDLPTGKTRLLGVSGLFVAIGHTPNTALFTGVLDTDEAGYLVTAPRTSRTNVEGVFACGDVMDPIYRQAVTAAGSGCAAAIDAERWLTEQE